MSSKSKKCRNDIKSFWKSINFYPVKNLWNESRFSSNKPKLNKLLIMTEDWKLQGNESAEPQASAPIPFTWVT